MASKAYAFIDAGGDLTSLSPCQRPLGGFGQLALCLGQCLFVLVKEAGIGYRLAVGEGSKLLKTDIDADHLGAFWQWGGGYFAGDGSIPFARRRALNRAGFRCPLKRPMLAAAEASYLAQAQTVFLECKALGLRVREAIVAANPFESRKPAFLPWALQRRKNALKAKSTRIATFWSTWLCT